MAPLILHSFQYCKLTKTLKKIEEFVNETTPMIRAHVLDVYHDHFI